ncbi:MAG: ribbon-helix-helix domain-containing protein [Spirochaetaceae bacterium]|nr:ribbon-helix-helix domain-containing protein [Spirochaetaceae bacterium]
MIMNAQTVLTTARLPRETADRMNTLARLRHKTKSLIVKESLDLYFEREVAGCGSFALGEGLFGRYASGRDDLSSTYKTLVKEKLHAKYHPD